ncbi:BrnT family toxin [Fulvimarina sp. 2208YS6-2-32]|uniref:BrnT family toxin n=1 Tax=Fulvimarina uroteuthidis TaxID=3098149 RepID=A0ABU5I1L5_9HYPH|nr:BrnT family toxin [Fulvimarina sp. 2208YS6-2-32]MDY8109032.1 BrnT family toxin [Fulvimarina sp. 2208YS6-2-32]
MDFEWDEAKDISNFRKHTIRFRSATAVFNDPARLVFEDEREDYGERRFIVMGLIGPRLYVVIFTERSGKIRIISARKGNEREKAVYGNRPLPT